MSRMGPVLCTDHTPATFDPTDALRAVYLQSFPPNERKDFDELLAAWGGTVVAENHLNVLRPITGETPALSRPLLARLLASAELDRVLRCISGSVAVSAFELEALPMPDAASLAAWENRDEAALRDALRETYGHLRWGC